jgi:hypothetical protein
MENLFDFSSALPLLITLSAVLIFCLILNIILKKPFFKKSKWFHANDKKIKIEEVIYIDNKTKVFLVNCKGGDFLGLSGSSNDILLQINGKNKAHNVEVEELLHAIK